MTQLSSAEIGRRIAAYRRRNGWSAQRLADNTDGAVSRATIANIESGRRTDIGLQQFLAICLALRVPPTALLVDLDHPFSPANVSFPGTAPAPFDPAAPHVMIARWLTGRLAADTTAAARHAGAVMQLLDDYLAALDAGEVHSMLDRLTAARRPSRDHDGEAVRQSLRDQLRAVGVEVPDP